MPDLLTVASVLIFLLPQKEKKKEIEKKKKTHTHKKNQENPKKQQQQATFILGAKMARICTKPTFASMVKCR